MSRILASTLVDDGDQALVRLGSALDRISRTLRKEWQLAQDLVGVIRDLPPSSAPNSVGAIDRVLTLCYAFAGEHLDIDSDLFTPPQEIDWQTDKFSQWPPGLNPWQKCEVGKAMVKLGVASTETRVRFRELAGVSLAQFSEDGLKWTASAQVPFFVTEPRRSRGIGRPGHARERTKPEESHGDKQRNHYVG
jgi:hypothetical protein